MKDIYELIRKAQEGNTEAKEKILLDNSGLVWSVVKRFHGRYDPEDLYQIGSIGLLKSIEKFDFSFEVRFSTYAVPMILGEIRRFLRDDGTLKVSRTLKELSYRAKKMQEDILKSENRELTITELANLMQVEKEELVLAIEATKEIESIYAVKSGKTPDTGLQLSEYIGDTKENEKMLERISLKEAINHLDQKERQIIFLRYFQDRTQMDVARRLDLSQVQVSRMEKKILSRLRDSLQ